MHFPKNRCHDYRHPWFNTLCKHPYKVMSLFPWFVIRLENTSGGIFDYSSMQNFSGSLISLGYIILLANLAMTKLPSRGNQIFDLLCWINCAIDIKAAKHLQRSHDPSPYLTVGVRCFSLDAIHFAVKILMVLMAKMLPFGHSLPGIFPVFGSRCLDLFTVLSLCHPSREVTGMEVLFYCDPYCRLLMASFTISLAVLADSMHLHPLPGKSATMSYVLCLCIIALMWHVMRFTFFVPITWLVMVNSHWLLNWQFFGFSQADGWQRLMLSSLYSSEIGSEEMTQCGSFTPGMSNLCHGVPSVWFSFQPIIKPADFTN